MFTWSKECKRCCIVIPDTTRHVIHKNITDDKGRFIILHVTVLGEELILVCVYAPTKNNQKDQVKMLSEISSQLVQFENKNFIIGGDFNIAINLAMDKRGGRIDHSESKQYREEMLAFLEAFELIDILRAKFPTKQKYSWHSKHLKVSSRLDYFFISEVLANRATKCDIKGALLTDHRMVQLTLQTLKNNVKGRGYWKFNSNLLHDKNYVQYIKGIISTAQDTFSCEKNYGLKWDLIKMYIRGETIKFCSKKKREQDMFENELNKQLQQLIQEHDTNQNSGTFEQINLLSEELEILTGKRQRVV